MTLRRERPTGPTADSHGSVEGVDIALTTLAATRRAVQVVPRILTDDCDRLERIERFQRQTEGGGAVVLDKRDRVGSDLVDDLVMVTADVVGGQSQIAHVKRGLGYESSCSSKAGVRIRSTISSSRDSGTDPFCTAARSASP